MDELLRKIAKAAGDGDLDAAEELLSRLRSGSPREWDKTRLRAALVRLAVRRRAAMDDIEGHNGHEPDYGNRQGRLEEAAAALTDVRNAYAKAFEPELGAAVERVRKASRPRPRAIRWEVGPDESGEDVLEADAYYASDALPSGTPFSEFLPKLADDLHAAARSATGLPMRVEALYRQYEHYRHFIETTAKEREAEIAGAAGRPPRNRWGATAVRPIGAAQAFMGAPGKR